MPGWRSWHWERPAHARREHGGHRAQKATSVAYRPVFRIVHLDDWCLGPANGDVQRLAADLAAEISAAQSEAAEANCLPLERYLAERTPRFDPTPATIPLSARSTGNRRGSAADERGAELQAMRVNFSRQRKAVDDHPLAQAARLEANLERLLTELETEVDRLVGASHEALDASRGA